MATHTLTPLCKACGALVCQQWRSCVQIKRRRKQEVLGLDGAIERIRSWGYTVRYEGQEPLRYRIVTPKGAGCIRRFHEVEHFARTGHDVHGYLDTHA